MPYHRRTKLGAGCFGEVWLEEDLALGRQCAAKYLNPTLLAGGAFDEARAMMVGAKHDHVVQVYAADLEQVVPGQPKVPVIRMEYLPSGSLDARYNRQPAPVGEIVRAIEDAARGVESLHTQGMLHRDLKPGNLLIADDGRIKVSDFGLAGPAAASGAPPIAYLRHLPPEAVGGSGVIDTVAGDIYALGVTTYRLVNGDALLDAVLPAGADLRQRIAEGKYPNRNRWRAHIHDQLRRVVRKAMNGDPAKRHGSAGELRHALEQARPAVSWALTATGPDRTTWDGVDSSSGHMWTASVAADGHGRWTFELKRQRPGGKLRACRVDALNAANHSAVERHASAVLQRVATTGR